MNFFVISHRCGHCVRHQLVMGQDEFEAAWRGCIGMACPLCDTRVREEDLQIILLENDVNAVKDGSFPWGKVNTPGAGFTRFRSPGSAPTFERGAFASALRGQMYGQAERNRKTELQALSNAFAKLNGFQFGHEAYEERNYAKAVVWLEKAAEALDDPTHAAGARLYLGLSRLELGERQEAKAAFSAAVAGKGVDPMIRASAADQLGSLLKELGDIAGARRAYQIAVDANTPLFSAKAALNLGTLEDEQGNSAKALPLWERAYAEAKQDSGTKAYATYNLGWYWENAGDVAKARRFYKLAVESGEGEAAARARRRLRGLGPDPVPAQGRARRGFFGRKR
jgi:tetratricopeptide (TPR) repeat protein